MELMMKPVSKTGVILLFAFVFLLLTTALFAQEKKEVWEIAPEIFYMEYEEPGIMTNKGTLLGVGVSYAYHKQFMFKLEGRASYGKVDYNSTNTGSDKNIPDTLFEIRGLLGYDIKLSESLTMTPYIGLGYRYLQDDSSGTITTTGARGYLRASNYYYNPVGIETVMVLDHGWSFGVTAEYDYFLEGRQKSDLSNANSNYNDLTNRQNSGYGVRGSIQIRKHVTDHFYFLEPFINYWEIDKSDDANITHAGVIWGYGWEPKNRTTEMGLKLGIGF
jgi:hypothetical protein